MVLSPAAAPRRHRRASRGGSHADRRRVPSGSGRAPQATRTDVPTWSIRPRCWGAERESGGGLCCWGRRLRSCDGLIVPESNHQRSGGGTPLTPRWAGPTDPDASVRDEPPSLMISLSAIKSVRLDPQAITPREHSGHVN
jgi:hypothetical protein